MDDQKKIVIDLEGKEQELTPRILIKEGEKQAVFAEFNVAQVNKYGSTTGEKEDKIIALFEIPGVIGFVPLFLSPIVTKSNSPKYSNSKAFDLLAKANLIGDFKQFALEKSGSISPDALAGFLQKKLGGRTASVLVENTKGEKPYSVVKKVYEVEER